MFAFCDGKRRKNLGYRSQSGVEYFGQSILDEKTFGKISKNCKKGIDKSKTI